jgi:hypothetical protein
MNLSAANAGRPGVGRSRTTSVSRFSVQPSKQIRLANRRIDQGRPTVEKNCGEADGQGPPCCMDSVTARPVGIRFSTTQPARITTKGTISAKAESSLHPVPM